MAGLVVSGTQVSYIGQDCREIPEHLGRDCGHFAKRLDLSFNLLSHIRQFAENHLSTVWFLDARQMPALLWVHRMLNDNKYSNYTGVSN
ncbi:unnamed protein product [Rangifer tarandus platyrhynchus]|uniref:Uncharacterized protein n=2 Tax=Rangifer tarandus platyrhynchus TaxID=3082113 RepID=A0ACB0FFB1_RANTA|nr:unnamed protein product [Rangifer tarandus platyrhynchus]